jgi:hypothetical protein
MKRVHHLLGMAGAAGAMGAMGTTALISGHAAHAQGASMTSGAGTRPKTVSMHPVLGPQAGNIRLVDASSNCSSSSCVLRTYPGLDPPNPTGSVYGPYYSSLPNCTSQSGCE